MNLQSLIKTFLLNINIKMFLKISFFQNRKSTIMI